MSWLRYDYWERSRIGHIDIVSDETVDRMIDENASRLRTDLPHIKVIGYENIGNVEIFVYIEEGS